MQKLYHIFTLGLVLAFLWVLPVTLNAQPIQPAALEQKDDDYVLGDANAPITMIEYASLSCSHCALFHNDVFPEIKKNYIDTGKVKFIFRDYPLNQPALRASMLARCAGKDRYFTFLKVLFETQNSWAFDKHYEEKLNNYGRLGGLKQEDINRCMQDTVLQDRILKLRMQGANELDINSTPTFFVQGERYLGSKDYPYFAALFEKILQ